MTPTSQPIAAPLGAVLSDLIQVGLFAKHIHWNVTGPMFGSLHLLLDELADNVATAADGVAERLRALALDADGRPTAVTAQLLADLPAGPLRDVDAIRAMTGMLDAVAATLGDTIDRCAEDPVSQDLLVSIAGDLDRRSWLFRAHL
jgi:starvation-inducible DNA-binding protein